MAEAAAPTKKYDPTIGVRVPAPVRDALKAMARDRNITVSEVLLDQIKPFELYASPEGQAAYERIRLAIAESTSVHIVVLHPGGGLPGTWEGLPVTWYGDVERPLCYHNVPQYEGESRQDAIRNYTNAIWKEWARYPERAEWEGYYRDKLLEEVTDADRHLFVMAYVNFKRWHKFPSPYELGLHRAWYVEGRGPSGKYPAITAEPKNQDEAGFLGIQSKKLARLWAECEKTGDRVRLTGADALPIWNEDGALFKHYPHITDEENIATWARQLLKLWREAGYPEPYLFSEGLTLAVDILRIEEP